MLCLSAPFRALMRRNLLYRKRNFIATLLEIVLPIGFAAILVAIKGAVDNDGNNLETETEPAVVYNDTDVMNILSFSDYVTAVLAKRYCLSVAPGYFAISGIPYGGTNWQVPFVKCDPRLCVDDMQEAYEFCSYPVLAVAPSNASDAGGMRRAMAFKEYVEGRYPQVLNTSLTHFPWDGYDFVKLFDSSSDIDDYVTSPGYGTPGQEEIALAVTFDGDNELDFRYSLRVNSTNYNSPELSSQPGAPTTPDTKTLFDTYAKEDNACPTQGPEQGELQDSCTGQYIYNGFLTTQRLVHDYIMIATKAKEAGYFVAESGVRYVQFPEREYEKTGALASLAEFMPLLMTLGILYSCATMISYVVQEKELRQKELLKMMGVTDLELGWSWFLSFWWIHIITATLVTLICSTLFTNSSFFLLFMFWQLCFLGFVVLSLLVGTFVSKATRGVLIGILLIFVGYFMTMFVKVDTGNIGTISLLSLHPVAAMSYALAEIGRLENSGVGLQPGSMTTTDAPSGYTFSSAYGNLLFSCIFMGILTWYLNRVIAPDYGQALPLYFPFTRSYWFPNSAVPHEEGKADEIADGTIPTEPVSDTLKQQSKDGQTIEIKNLRKDFGEKLAVDGLNLSIYNGQITALLGHNGAGKTTTISMLTGALSPTEGTASIAGKDIRTEMSSIRGDIGICLQHDCLFPKLTVREHVQFFSRVKGVYDKMPFADAETSVDQAIRDVALEEKSNTFSANLSGGMKRKLSVAMAFCGGSKVVFLDEPTSGMDPFSRRFSWNVIRQYRQGRCIILTTHFMDEADILGDRIAIMAEGRLRCCGSSLFLKKTYGVGYQLTIEKRSKHKGEGVLDRLDSSRVSGSSRRRSSHPLPEDVPGPDPRKNLSGAEAARRASSRRLSDRDIDTGDAATPRNSTTTSNNHHKKGIDNSHRSSASSEEQSKDKAENGSNNDKVDVGDVDDALKDIVKGAVKEAALLSNVGTEMSFQLPLGASDRFVSIFERLDELVKKGRIATYGVSITTLDEVFLLVARGEDVNKHDFQSSHFSSKNLANEAGMVNADDSDRSVHSKMDLDNETLFGTHVSALMKKRALNFKRDKKAWCCTTILPSMFVLVGLLLLKFLVPDRNMSPMPLNMDEYNKDVIGDKKNPIAFNSPGYFSCNPGTCTFNMSTVDIENTNENYFFCGGPALADSSTSCSINQSESITTKIDEAGAYPNPDNDATNITEASTFLLYQSANELEASQYGAIYFNHDMSSSIEGSGKLYGTGVSQNCSENPNEYLGASQCELIGTGIGYTISYNFTAIHVAPLFQVLADEAIIRRALDSDTFLITAINQPLRVTKREADFNEAQGTTTLWSLIILSFPCILGAFATFVVVERESKAKHLQTVAGVTPAAYWLSTFLWDSINYLIPAGITVILVFAFDLSAVTTTAKGMIGGFMTLLFLFGPAAASFSYCVSFMFKSPSLCNNMLIVSGFLVGMGASLTVFILTLIAYSGDPNRPNDTLRLAANIVTWICRFFPTFCLGKGLLFAFNVSFFEYIYGKELTVFDPEIMLIEVIFLVLDAVLYLGLAIFLDKLSSNPEAMLFLQHLLCRTKSSESSAVAAIPDDDDVLAEQQRILNGAANDDAIVMSELTKIYPNGKIAVNKLSLGIAPGECFGLLGINGAGKTTTMGMLTAEFPPTSGDATLAGFSLRHEPEKTRRRIGYCPQFDAHFQNLTGREHVELYASIKGIPSNLIKAAAAEKLAQVGLSEKDSDRLSSHYSGGMKRRLSLACATIGAPQLVFLDECSTGVDPVARREIWQLVSDLVATEVEGVPKTSVILTTHSMDECEALCPRIGIMANGKLRCLGSAQRLKSKFGRGFQIELKVAAVGVEDEDFKTNLVSLARSKGVGPDEEAVAADTDIFFSLPEAQHALQQLTGDEYLSSMLHATNPTGSGVFKDASSPTGVLVSGLASFVANELRMRDLLAFVAGTYAGTILRERQDMKARFEVSSDNVSIAQIFASIEDNKAKLKLTDYGVSQTSLEQVFNMHAAEAERLKQGRMDG